MSASGVADPGALVTVGRIVSVYGVNGWVKVVSLTEPPGLIFELFPWRLAASDGSLETVEIDSTEERSSGLLAHVAGVDDRDLARRYCQKDIRVDKGVLPGLEAGRYYWHQLIGLKVYSTCAGQLTLLGAVRQMVATGANDVMVVAPCAGSCDKRERWLPYLTGHYGIKVDLSAQTLKIDWDPEF